MIWWECLFSSLELSGDDAAFLLTTCGAEGCVVREEPALAASVTAYFHTSKEALLSSIDAIQARYPLKCLSFNEVENVNWVQKSTAFSPLTIGKLIITPLESESSPHPPSSSNLYIIPGLGFGTGHHETTKMLLGIMQDASLIKRPPKTALDVGTGSGILAIAAAKLWQAETAAIDNDEDALKNAAENSALNNINANLLRFIAGEINSVDGVFDLIFANLYAELLATIEAEIAERLAAQGILLLSGILFEKLQMVIDSFSNMSWSNVSSFQDGQWCSIVLTRN
jgi:ribosomal protein L11 methyltransferase